MPPQTLLAGLLLDALDEFERAIAQVPAPGRHRRLGRLNAPGWTIAHVTSTVDGWINVFGRGLANDDWSAAWFAAQFDAPRGVAVETSFDEALAAFHRAFARTRSFLETVDPVALALPVAFPAPDWNGRPFTYFLARASAHVFAHAGELGSLAALVGAGDLGLPGELPASRAAAADAADGDGTPAIVAQLLRDARDEVARIARALPLPGRRRTVARLNAGALTLAHLAAGNDLYWNVESQGLPADPWLADATTTADRDGAMAAYSRALDARERDGGASVDFDEAFAAYARMTGRSEAHIAKLVVPGAAPAAERARLAHDVGHFFAHAGELATLASLVGAPDLGVPGRLRHVSEALTAT